MTLALGPSHFLSNLSGGKTISFKQRVVLWLYYTEILRTYERRTVRYMYEKIRVPKSLCYSSLLLYKSSSGGENGL